MTDDIVERWLSNVDAKARGRTRYEGQEPFVDESVAAEIRTLRAQIAEAERKGAVPDGWILVPKEPTEEILAAMGYDDPFWDYKDSYVSKEDMASAYKKAIAALPTQEPRDAKEHTLSEAIAALRPLFDPPPKEPSDAG